MPKVGYEWCVEHLEVDTSTPRSEWDIVDHDFSESLSELDWYDVTDCSTRLVLVRDTYTEETGLQDREWAYPVHIGCDRFKLPESFTDAFDRETGTKIPKKYQAEFNKIFG